MTLPGLHVGADDAAAAAGTDADPSQLMSRPWASKVLPLVRPLSARKTENLAAGGHLEDAIADDVAEEDIVVFVHRRPFKEAHQGRHTGLGVGGNQTGWKRDPWQIGLLLSGQTCRKTREQNQRRRRLELALHFDVSAGTPAAAEQPGVLWWFPDRLLA